MEADIINFSKLLLVCNLDHGMMTFMVLKYHRSCDWDQIDNIWL